MNKYRKEYCLENGMTYIKPENTPISGYVEFLEKKLDKSQYGSIEIEGVVEKITEYTSPTIHNQGLISYRDIPKLAQELIEKVERL